MTSSIPPDPVPVMNDTAARIRFKARLLQPAQPAKGGSWTFLVLPKKASAKLPTRGMAAVEGVINDHPFRAVLAPDGNKGTGTAGTGRSVQGASRHSESVGDLEGIYDHCAQGLDPLDHFRQAARDARAPHPQRLRYARDRETPGLLLRPVRVLQQGLQRAGRGERDLTPHGSAHGTD